jgi:hypothetical protein
MTARGRARKLKLDVGGDIGRGRNALEPQMNTDERRWKNKPGVLVASEISCNALNDFFGSCLSSMRRGRENAYWVNSGCEKRIGMPKFEPPKPFRIA